MRLQYYTGTSSSSSSPPPLPLPLPWRPPLAPRCWLLWFVSQNAVLVTAAFSVVRHRGSHVGAAIADRTHSSRSSKTFLAAFGLGGNGAGSGRGRGNTAQLSPLPTGVSPFEKSLAKGTDVQASFRRLAVPAIDLAVRQGFRKLEVDFPPFVGGDQSKTNFDDYDNLQELNANRDWCVQVAPELVAASQAVKQRAPCWLILPDDKECELAAKEWTGQRYRKASKFTSIRAALSAVAGDGALRKAWGSNLAETVNKLTGGDGILADSSTLDDLDVMGNRDRFYLVCQPGNGGPVEDWINVENLHRASDPEQVTCVVNGALDKVRDGYYPALFFPALAATVPFYKQFEAVFYLRPIVDKGLYGWIYRVYPEPWQIVLQTAQPKQKGKQTIMEVLNTVALVSDQRPSYQQAVQALLRAASTVS